MEVQVSAPSFSCTPQQSGWAWCHSKGDIPEGPASGRTCSGLASGVGPEVSCEPEGLVDGQVGLDNEHGGAGGLGLLEHVSSPPVEHSVDTTNCVLRALKTE